MSDSFYAKTASNLSDVASATTARTNLGLGTAATQASSAFDATGAATAAQAAAIAASLPTLTANVTASSSATLAVNTVTECSAGSNLTMTLPTSVAGALIVVEKSDSSVNTVAVTGNVRGVGSSTLTLKLQNESMEFLGYAGSWWPIAGHKTLGSLDSRYTGRPSATEARYFVSSASYASDSNDGLTVASAKATIASAVTALGSSAGEIILGAGAWTISAADGNGNGVTLAHASQHIRGMGVSTTTINIATPVTWGILCQGQFSGVHDVYLSTSGSGTATYGMGVDVPTTANGSAESCQFENCDVATAGSITNSYAVAPLTSSFNVDIAETMFRRCRSVGPSNAGFLIGNGTSGNILNTHMHQCSAVAGVYGVYGSATGWTWMQGDVGENTTSDFYQSSVSTADPIVVDGVRSENSARLWQTNSQGTSILVSLRNIGWAPTTFMSATGDWISHNLGGSLILDNVKCLGGSYTPYIPLGTTGHLTVEMRGCSTSAPLEQLFHILATQTIAITVEGYTQLSSSGGDPPVLCTPGPIRLGWSGGSVTINGTSLQVASPVEKQTLASNAAVTISGGAQYAEITLQANATSSSVTNLWLGQPLTISWIQDATGGRTYAWPSACKFTGGVTPTPSTAANAADSVTFYYDGTSLIQADAGSVALAGDLSGTLAAPTVAKLQGTAVSSPPGGTTSFLAGNGTWQVPVGSAGGTLPATTSPTTTATLANGPAAAFASTAGGAYTITLGNAATAGAGISQFVTKTTTDASALSVIPPSGGETIGGTTTAYKLFASGDRLEVMSDGANWQVIQYQVADVSITSTQTFTVPGGWSLIDATVLGGGSGGAGGGTSSGNTAQSGGAGGTASISIGALLAVTPALSLTCTIGAGGTGGGGAASGGATGSTGGNGNPSSISGTGIAVTSPGAQGGTGGTLNSTANPANPAWGNPRVITGAGGASTAYAGGAGGTTSASGGDPIGYASGGGGGGGPANTGSVLGGGAGSPGTPTSGGAGGVSGGSGTVAGVTGSNAASTSYGAGGGGGGGGANGTGAGGAGGNGGPGLIILRRRG